MTRGQVEILGGGFYEPVLASLPERDRIGQLTRMADELESMFGERPRGAWLAERVWEPDLPTSLVASGYEWTILDDAHFRAAAIPEADLWGPYTTEDQGQLLRVFGTEQGLRYRIPFREVDEVIGYLREHATDAGDRVGMMGDDGEKFGGWPTTWQHCWGEGRWVERFFEAIEANADWLTTTTPSAWLADHPPIGRVYIPTGSYAEMGEWALPADESLVFSNLLHEAQERRRPEARWLRGAFWRNFQVKYREINDLHKQMLRASEAVAAMPDGPDRDAGHRPPVPGPVQRLLLARAVRRDLHQPHAPGHVRAPHRGRGPRRDRRRDTLVAAEARDLDMDGVDEVRLADRRAGRDGRSRRGRRHRRLGHPGRPPRAHRRHAPPARGVPRGPARVRGGRGPRRRRMRGRRRTAPASIHGVVRVKEPGLAARLVYDRYERRSGLVRALGHEVSAEDWAQARATDLGDAVDGAFELVELAPGRLVTRRDGQDRRDRRGRDAHADARWRPARSDPRARTWSWSIAAGRRSTRGSASNGRRRCSVAAGTPPRGGRWRANGRATMPPASATDLTTIAQGNDHIGLSVTTTTDAPADAWWAPIETISNSENGFERVYQGSGLLLSWPVRLGAGERWSRTVASRRRDDPGSRPGRVVSRRLVSRPA